MNANHNTMSQITVSAKITVNSSLGAFQSVDDVKRWMLACLNCNTNHATVGIEIDQENLCASDDPAFKAQIAGLQEMTAVLNASARQDAAETLFQNFDFGEEVEVADADGWEHTTPGNLWTRKVYVESDDGEASVMLTFTVDFSNNASPTAYAIDSNGNIWGTPA